MEPSGLTLAVDVLVAPRKPGDTDSELRPAIGKRVGIEIPAASFTSCDKVAQRLRVQRGRRAGGRACVHTCVLACVHA